MEDTKFELEENFEEEDFEDDYEEEETSKAPYILLAVFIILFLTVTSLFVYYQFYLGQGKWDFSMKKRSSSAVLVNEDLQKENEALKIRIDSLQKLLAQDTIVAASDNSGSSAADQIALFPEELAGVKYEVQMGAFKNYDFTKYDPYLVNMNVDVEDGFNKLLIGRFDDFNDACAFRQDLKLMGLTGTFIVKKVDGERVKFDKWCP